MVSGRIIRISFYLYLKDIEHSRTKARHPQTNGITERLTHTLLDEFYKVAFRKKIYASLEDFQADLDEFLHGYTTKRTNQGKQCLRAVPRWRLSLKVLNDAGPMSMITQRR